MTLLNRIIAFLEMHGCWYRHDVHPLSYTARETAQADHVPPRCFAKTVVVHYADGYALAVLPADRIVNLNDLREAFGSPSLRLATEHEVGEIFPDCDLGAMPPFGNGALYSIPVYADGLLMSEDAICFNAGTHRDVIHMHFRDFERLVQPSVVAFSRRAGAMA